MKSVKWIFLNKSIQEIILLYIASKIPAKLTQTTKENLFEANLSMILEFSSVRLCQLRFALYWSNPQTVLIWDHLKLIQVSVDSINTYKSLYDHVIAWHHTSIFVVPDLKVINAWNVALLINPNFINKNQTMKFNEYQRNFKFCVIPKPLNPSHREHIRRGASSSTN